MTLIKEFQLSLVAALILALPAHFVHAQNKYDHRLIIQKIFSSAPPTTDPPTIVFMAGGFGSGKSTVRTQLNASGLIPKDQYLVIDADDLRELLPRYKTLKKKVGTEEAIRQTSDEAIALTNEVRTEAMKRKISIVLDQSLRGRGAASWVKGILSENPLYKSELIYVDTQPDIAAQRVRSRAQETGRGAPSRMIKISRDGAKKTADALKSIVGTTFEINNDEQPILVAVTSHGQTQQVGLPLDQRVLSFKDQPAPVSESTQGFNRAKEFPNLFLDRKYWTVDPSKVPQSAVNDARELANKALYSILSRMTAPVVPPGAKSPVTVPILEYLSENGGEDVDLMPLIRSAFGKLYADLFESYRGAPDKYEYATELKRIAADQHPISVSDVWGVGSDFDVLIQGGSDEKGHATKLKDILDSVRTHYNVAFSKSGENRAIYLLGDVKPYGPQIERSAQQGGSTLDFVAFDMKTKKLVDPPQFPGTVDNLFRGLRAYAPSVLPKSTNELEVTLARSMRPATEIPYLQLDSDSNRRMLQDFDKVSGTSTEDGLGQVAKAIRNSRFSAGNNLLLRSDPSSVEGRFLEFTKKSLMPFPEFLESYSIPESGRDGKDLPKEAIVSMEDFLKKYYKDQSFFHGTPEQSNYLSILRNNFLISRQGQGTAVYNRGVYMTNDESFARSYTGSGVVIPLEIRTDRKLNIVDGEKIKKTQFFKKLLKTYKTIDGVYQELAKNYGVDLIIATDRIVLLENAEAIKMPDVSTLIKVTVDSLHDDKLSTVAKIRRLNEVERLTQYARDIGVSDVPDIKKIRTSLIAKAKDEYYRLIKNGASDKKSELSDLAEVLLDSSEGADPKFVNSIFELSGYGLDRTLATKAVARLPSAFIPLFNSNEDYGKQHIQWRLMEFFGDAPGNLPLDFEPILIAKLQKQTQIHSSARVAHALGGLTPHANPHLEEILLNLLSKADGKDAQNIANAFKSIQIEDPKNLNRFLDLISEKMIFMADGALRNQFVPEKMLPDYRLKILKLASEGLVNEYATELFSTGNWEPEVEKEIGKMASSHPENTHIPSRSWAIRMIQQTRCESETCLSALERAALGEAHDAAFKALEIAQRNNPRKTLEFLNRTLPASPVMDSLLRDVALAKSVATRSAILTQEDAALVAKSLRVLKFASNKWGANSELTKAIGELDGVRKSLVGNKKTGASCVLEVLSNRP